METTSFTLRSLDAIHLGIAHHYGYKLFTFDQIIMDVANEFEIEVL